MRNILTRSFFLYCFLIIFIMFLLGTILHQVLHNMDEPIEDVAGYVTSISWLLIGLAGFLIILVLVLISYNTFEKYVKPIQNVSEVTEKLAEGNYNARTYEAYFGAAETLATSVNLLAKNLQEVTMQQEEQTNRLTAVIENMNSGLLLINNKGYIQLVNKAFLEDFNGNPNEYIGYLYYEALPFEIVHSVVKDVFMLEETIQKTFNFKQGIEQKYLSISGAPIFNNQHKCTGVVLVFHNITELKKLEEMRKDFVANVSHELKTPITSIKGFAETLLEGAKDDPQALEHFLHIINKESGRMQSLIQDLLELSRLEKSDIQLQLQQVSLNQLINETTSFVAPAAQDKEIEIVTNIDGDYSIYADPNRITQLLLNLITNAIHYTKSGGNITMSLEQEGDYVKFIISDTGIGIPEEELPRIFERFYRVDKARSRNSGGTGLGLAIVKHIVEAHHGKIEVESEVNKGTTFTIYLKVN